MKSEVFPFRLSDYEKKQSCHLARMAGVSQAELFRIGLRCIATDTQPSQMKELKKLYVFAKEGNYDVKR